MSRDRLIHVVLLAAGVSSVMAAPPPAPEATRAAPLGRDSHVIRWNDVEGESGYRIERRNGSQWDAVATAAANATTWLESGRPDGELPEYRIIAFNQDGDSPPGTSATSVRMNVLFFYADDLGYKDVVANRNPAIDGPTIYETPNIDSLAAEGVNFNRAYCSAPKCVTARRALQTGMVDFRTAAIAKNGGIGNEMVTMGEAMKAGGYRTCFIGKWHLGGKLEGSTSGGDEDFSSGGLVPHQSPVYTDWSALPETDIKFIPASDPNHDEGNKIPATQGYDVAIATGEWGAPPISYFANAPTGVPGEYWYGLPDLYSNDPNEYLTERLTSEATGFITGHLANHASQPFFLMLAHYAVHTPLEARPADVAYFDAKRATMAAQFATHPAGAGEQIDLTSKVRMHQDQTTYAAMLKSFDESLANLRAHLAATPDPRNPGKNLGQTTIIVFSSDHGGKSTHWINSGDSTDIPTANYPLRQGKTWCYEGGLRVPLVVHWPGIGDAGRTAGTLVHGADFYTSILDMTGTPRVPSQHLDSLSFAAAVADADTETRSESHHWFTNADDGTGNPALGAYRRGDYKLVHHINRRISELYNIAEDEGEQNDIASIRPDLTGEMFRALLAKRDESGSRPPLPTSNSWSTELLVLAPVMDIPAVPDAAPTGLSGTAVSSTAIDLTWNDTSGNEERFVIQRKLQGSGAFLEVATVPANTSRFRDTGLIPSTSYQYRIQAETLGGWAGPSNQITVPTPATGMLPIIARGDWLTTLKNEERIIQPLVNDQGENLSVIAIGTSSLGTLEPLPGNRIRFVPHPGVVGEDDAFYTVAGDAGSGTGAIRIRILADHTVTPEPIFDLTPVREETLVDSWEFGEAAGTRIGLCANGAPAATSSFTGSQTFPSTDGNGNLRIVQSTAANDTFRVTTTASSGIRALGQPGAGVFELSIIYAAADLSGGDADGAYAGAALRDGTLNTDLLAFRLQESGGNLQLQLRNPGQNVLATLSGSVLTSPISARAEVNLATRSAKVYYNIGSGEVFAGNFGIDPAATTWSIYRVASANRSPDFGPTDFITIDAVRVKEIEITNPPAPHPAEVHAARWFGTAEAQADERALWNDPDLDGVTNLMEFALGANPASPVGGPSVHGRMMDSPADVDSLPELVFTLPVRLGAKFLVPPSGGGMEASVDGVHYRVEAGSDPNQFDLAVEEVHPALESGLPPLPREGWEYRSFRLPDSNGLGMRSAFMRLRAESLP